VERLSAEKAASVLALAYAQRETRSRLTNEAYPGYHDALSDHCLCYVIVCCRRDLALSFGTISGGVSGVQVRRAGMPVSSIGS
jgi:hypothetical protein